MNNHIPDACVEDFFAHCDKAIALGIEHTPFTTFRRHWIAEHSDVIPECNETQDVNVA